MSPKLAGFSASISLRDASVSTSGSYIRHWSVNGHDYHHIKTPGEIQQDTTLASVTIVSEHGYISDGLATAIFAMGLKMGYAFCESHAIDALFIDRDAAIFYTPHFDTKYELQI